MGLTQALSFDDKEQKAGTLPAETHPQGNEPVEWVVVQKTGGLVPAEISAERLIADGIPARAWQEGAGQALGLTVGILGEGRVLVPAEFEEHAREILANVSDEPIDWQDFDGEPETLG